MVLISVNIYHGTLLKLQEEIVFSNIVKLSTPNVDAGNSTAVPRARGTTSGVLRLLHELRHRQRSSRTFLLGRW